MTPQRLTQPADPQALLKTLAMNQTANRYSQVRKESTARILRQVQATR